ncbi:hypothetical protein PMI18_05874 [Pseudomonas sp. GM102]|nr:hypothetical protein PMI18_05874 [Pseudomonas sp. GM102]
MRCSECTAAPLWRGSLLPFGCAAVVNPANAISLKYRSVWVLGCFATQREQAPSPQLSVFQA